MENIFFLNNFLIQTPRPPSNPTTIGPVQGLYIMLYVCIHLYSPVFLSVSLNTLNCKLKLKKEFFT